ncbi:universal stress protein [Hansschlegelia zhihuaiae]|uniref:Universal stress protein n=1 Tax=Hansschlegelia zhihuaiae TaxID=405005 RepID=A0A4Q0MI70_9HYPH|nr:universal stress protein [Hansschlegelia zhihuaiae]RXF73164.1 universal stress protein [Hansschlegelia zhihuaiae]
MSSSTIAVMSVELERSRPPYRRILVPTDGSALSQGAVFEALELAASIGASVVLLTVNEPFRVLTTSVEMIESTREEYERHAEAHADKLLQQAGAWADDAGVPHSSVRKWSDQPYEEIIKVAHEHNCDLIAMASHGRRGLSAIVLGSVTHKVLTHSDIPVLVLRKSVETTAQRSLSAAEGVHDNAGNS